MYARKRSPWKSILIALMIMLFLSGLALMMYPYIHGAIVDREIALNAEEFLSWVEILPFVKPTDPNGTIYNEGSSGVTCSKEKTYTNFKIHEPIDGKWSVTYKSDVPQTIVPQFIFHADLTVALSKNQNDIMQKKPVQYIATVMTKGTEISDDNSLSGFEAKLVIVEIDDQGQPAKTKSEKMNIFC